LLSTFGKLDLSLECLDLFPTLEDVLLFLGKVDGHDRFVGKPPRPVLGLQTKWKVNMRDRKSGRCGETSRDLNRSVVVVELTDVPRDPTNFKIRG
jgi:hypothetical protein